jgi:LPS-assembly lipoprotein
VLRDLVFGVSIPEAEDRVGQLIRNDLLSSMRRRQGRGQVHPPPEARGEEERGHRQAAAERHPGSSPSRSATSWSTRSSGSIVHSGKTFSQASYDVIRQPFADLQAETNATERAVHEVSADIRTRLAAYFATQQPKS